MRKKKFWMILLCVVLVTAFAASGFPAASAESSLDDMNKELQSLANQESKLQSQIDKAKAQKSQQQATKAQLDSQVSNLNAQIKLYNDKIALLTRNIADKDALITQKEAEIDQNLDLFKDRLRAMYMTNESTTLGIFLGVDSFFDFLTRTEFLQAIARHDNDVVNQMITAKKAVEAAKAQVESEQADLAASKAAMEQTKQTLNTKISEANQQIQNIAAEEAAYQANYKELQKEEAAVQAQITQFYKDHPSEGILANTNFGWPLPGYTYISSPYGWRFNNTDFHTGIDITGGNVLGKDIVASNAGRVIFVTRTYVPGKSYGEYLIIDHGGGYSTLYGHCSAIYVNVGDIVQKGQRIAAVGSTGWATGPHLHFEIRINGATQNPSNYVRP